MFFINHVCKCVGRLSLAIKLLIVITLCKQLLHHLNYGRLYLPLWDIYGQINELQRCCRHFLACGWRFGAHCSC